MILISKIVYSIIQQGFRQVECADHYIVILFQVNNGHLRRVATTNILNQKGRNYSC